MNETVLVAAGLAFWTVAGMVLGTIYFGGLWLTLSRVAACSNPRAACLASFALRLALVLAGLRLAIDYGPAPFGLALAGIFLARVLAVHRIKIRAPRPVRQGREERA